MFSVLGIAIVSPLFIPIMIANRLTGEGHIFYSQERMGLHNSRFKILKFATMLKNSANMKGGSITLRNDSRITPVGKYLRITKLNELPQLLNVIKGDMSFVGPRPLMPISFEKYTKEVQQVIYNCKPGITGIGSVIFRDEEKLVSDAKLRGEDPMDFYKKKIFPIKGRLEIWYQNNQSIVTDLKILILTFVVIFSLDSKLISFFFPNLPIKNNHPIL